MPHLCVQATDWSLRGQQLRLSATIGGQQIERTVAGGANVSLSFPLRNIPTTLSADVVLSVALPDGRVAAHTRVFERVPPPEESSFVSTWQVDHAGPWRAVGAFCR